MDRLVTAFLFILTTIAIANFAACQSRVEQQKKNQTISEQPAQMSETPQTVLRQRNMNVALQTVAQHGHISEVTSIAFSPDGSILASGGGFMDGTVKLWRVSDGSLIRTLKSRGCGVDAVTFSPDGTILAAGGGCFSYGTVSLWKVSDGSLIRVLETNEGSVTLVSFSPDGAILASDSKVVKLWKVSDGSLIRTCAPGCRPRAWKVSSGPLAYSPDGSIVASASKEGVTLRKVSDRSLIRTLGGYRGAAISVAFSPNGKILASGHGNGMINLWNVFDGSLIRTLKGHKTAVFSVSFAGNVLISRGGNEDRTSYYQYSRGRVYEATELVKLWNVSNGSLVKTLKGGEREIRAQLWVEMGVLFMPGKGIMGGLKASSPDGKMQASVYREGAVEIRRTQGDSLLVTLFALGANATVAITPEGFFSGTGDVDRYVHFVSGLEVHHFNQFYDAFYRPDLVEKKLKGEDISKYTGGLNIEDAIKNPPPQVAILSPEHSARTDQRKVTVKVKIADTGGKIGEVRLYHNGKLVRSAGIYRLAKGEEVSERVEVAYADVNEYYRTARGATLRRIVTEREETQVEDYKPRTGTIEETYEVTLVSGENTISVSAFNGDNTVMSALETIKVKADVPPSQPELYVLAVGNDHFKDSNQNLFLAIKDSADFSEKINKAAAGLYGSVHITTLHDTTKPGIFRAMQAISANMKPEDVFILFVASHGIAQDDLYYIFTSDFDGVKRRENTISSVELMELSKKIPALKQIFVLDTCQAGGIKAAVSGLYDARVSVLAKALGMHIFAGAKTFQQAKDQYKGNGLFTYFVLRGLEGQADANSDKQVRVFEMNPYLIRTVKEASKGSQEPFIRTFGEDLPIARVSVVK